MAPAPDMPQSTLNPILNKRFNRAIELALELHRKQVRKRALAHRGDRAAAEVPYFSHLMIVAGTVLDYGGTQAEASAALLHDSVEDQGGLPTLKRIRNTLGPEVARIVLGCTDSLVTDESRREPWKLRKARYLAHLEEADESVLLVSIADKLHNCRAALRDLRREGERFWARFNAGRAEQLWYYRALAEVALRRGKGTRAEELVSDFALAVRELDKRRRG